MKRQFTIQLCTALVLMFGTLLLNAVQPPRPPIKPPMPPVRMARMLFLSNQGSTHFRLYSMYLDGSDVRQIPNWTDNDNWPTYSPDGRTIVFASWRTGSWHLFAMNADGSGVRQLTNGPNQEMEPVFSPAGGVLAFTCKGQGWQDICLATDRGTGVVKLTDGRALYSSPAFSPNGQTMAFVGLPKPSRATSSAGIAPSLAPPPPPSMPDIYVLRTYYPVPVKVTDGSVARYSPVFTPDGKHIIYDQDTYGNDGADAGLFVMGLDGCNQQPLTYYSGMPSDEPGVVGTKVIFAMTTVNGGVDIFSMNLDGSQMQRLTVNGATNLRYLNMFDY